MGGGKGSRVVLVALSLPLPLPLSLYFLTSMCMCMQLGAEERVSTRRATPALAKARLGRKVPVWSDDAAGQEENEKTGRRRSIAWLRKREIRRDEPSRNNRREETAHGSRIDLRKQTCNIYIQTRTPSHIPPPKIDPLGSGPFSSQLAPRSVFRYRSRRLSGIGSVGKTSVSTPGWHWHWTGPSPRYSWSCPLSLPPRALEPSTDDATAAKAHTLPRVRHPRHLHLGACLARRARRPRRAQACACEIHVRDCALPRPVLSGVAPHRRRRRHAHCTTTAAAGEKHANARAARSLPAYHSPLRHHKRAASSTRRVKVRASTARTNIVAPPLTGRPHRKRSMRAPSTAIQRTTAPRSTASISTSSSRRLGEVRSAPSTSPSTSTAKNM